MDIWTTRNNENSRLFVQQLRSKDFTSVHGNEDKAKTLLGKWLVAGQPETSTDKDYWETWETARDALYTQYLIYKEYFNSENRTVPELDSYVIEYTIPA